MSATRVALGLVGIVCLGMGLGTVLAPSLATRVDIGAVVGNEYLVVAPLGLAAISVTLGVLAKRSITGIDQAMPPDPERVPTAPIPGAVFDRLVGGGWRTALAAHRERERLHRRLREAAIRTVMRTERCQRETARRRIEAGTWTEDPAAATFLAGDGGHLTGGSILAAAVNGESPLQRQARNAARAIDRTARGDRS